jgi:hypothetical protein
MKHIDRLIELNKELQRITELRLAIEDELIRCEQGMLNIHGDGETFNPFVYKTDDGLFLCAWKCRGSESYVSIEPITVTQQEVT